MSILDHSDREVLNQLAGDFGALVHHSEDDGTCADYEGFGGVFGIDVGQAGSHGDVRTMLVAGVDPALQQQIAEHFAQLETCREEIIQLNERIAPFKPRLKSLTPILRKKLEEYLKELEKVEGNRQQLEEELGHLQDQSKELLK